MNVEGLKEALDELAARRAAAPLLEARMDKIATERDQYLSAEIDNRQLRTDLTAARASEARMAEALNKISRQCPNSDEELGDPSDYSTPVDYAEARVDSVLSEIGDEARAAIDSSTALSWLEAHDQEAVEKAISAISAYRILIITEAVGKSAMDGSETVYIEVDKEWLRTTAGLTAKDEPEEKV